MAPWKSVFLYQWFSGSMLVFQGYSHSDYSGSFYFVKAQLAAAAPVFFSELLSGGDNGYTVQAGEACRAA